MIGCGVVCGDSLCKKMGVKVNNKQCVKVSCCVGICKVREEITFLIGLQCRQRLRSWSLLHLSLTVPVGFMSSSGFR